MKLHTKPIPKRYHTPYLLENNLRTPRGEGVMNIQNQSEGVGFYFVPVTPEEVSTEDTYKIWMSYSDWKFVITVVKQLRGKRGDFNFEGSGALLSEINPRILIHRCHVKSLKSLRSLEVNEKHHQNSGGKEGKFSISRVVGSNFPKNTPGECSIEDTYQIWRSYSDEKLVKIVTKIKGGGRWKRGKTQFWGG